MALPHLASRLRRAALDAFAPRAPEDPVALHVGLASRLAASRGLDPSRLPAVPGSVEQATRGLAELAVELDGSDGAAVALGVVHEAWLDAQRGDARRARGAHYTPRALTERVVQEALALRGPTEEIPFVCDPAMGAGAFLCEAVRRLGGADPARRRAAASRFAGIDRDPVAVAIARLTLWLEIGDPTLDPAALAMLVAGDALVDAGGDAAGVDWHRAFAPAFEAGRGGFDLVLGNPPFLGGKRIRTVHGDAYAARLAALHPGASKNADLAAHFLLRGYEALRPGGVLAFVATNTIAQGATRVAGLGAIVARGGSIGFVERRVRWPGQAGVVVSLLGIVKGALAGPARLDGREVAEIDSFFTSGGHATPARLPSQRRRAFIGCFLRGAGFVIDDDDPRATPSAVLDAALAEDPGSAAVVRPLLGGHEVMNHTAHLPHRRVIAMGGRSLEEASLHPGALAVLASRVRPVREALSTRGGDAQHRAAWWRFANHRPELARATASLDRVIVVPRVAAHLVAVLVPNDAVFTDQLVVFASDSPAILAVLSSEAHALWARTTCSTLGDGLRYLPSAAFETFPMPCGGFDAAASDPVLEAAGRELDETRRAILDARGWGLTRLYRAVHDPAVDASDVEAVRAAHDRVDAAVFAALHLPVPAARVFLGDGRGARRRALPAEEAARALAGIFRIAAVRARAEGA